MIDFGAELGIFWTIFPRLMCLAAHNRKGAKHRDWPFSPVLLSSGLTFECPSRLLRRFPLAQSAHCISW